MTDADALIEFIRARLDEDEWAAGPEARGWETGSRYEGQPLAWVQHVRNWPVARVLREVEAKRRILDLCAPRADLTFIGSGFPPGDETELAAAMLAALALPFSDHPDYRKEWRPGA